MKKLLLLTLVMIFGMTVFAQGQKRLDLKSLQKISMPAPASAIDNQTVPGKPGNPTVNTKSILEDVLGGTRYDMQTNGSIQDRLYLYDDGKMAATWTRGMLDPSYTDRGTGYNFFDGTSWGAEPSSRIESMRTGWPAICPLGDGELIISHQSATLPLVMNKRPTRGSGTWTQSTIPMPSGVSGLTWHRVITSGPNHNYIHMIALTGPTANGGQIYNGLDGALLYYRSLDGGATWDKLGIQLPGMTSTDYWGFNGDEYAWAAPHGDTIAFMVGGSWIDTFIMKSYDNGSTWTRVQVVNNPNRIHPEGVFTLPYNSNDGCNAIEMDKNGVFHVAFGRMRVNDDGSGHYYYPWTDGIVYWNTNMPPLDDSLFFDTLWNHNQILGYVSDPGTGDTIIDFPKYYVSLSSFPQLTIDPDGQIWAIWSSVTVGNPSPDNLNYRHIWARTWNPTAQQWSEIIDLNQGLMYVYREFIYASMAKKTTADKIHFIYQTADQPGANMKDTSIPVHDNNIEYRAESKAYINQGVGVANKYAPKNDIGEVYPNPVSDIAHINVSLATASDVTLSINNISGQNLMNINKGQVTSGIHTFDFNVAQLPSGIYFCTVSIGNQSITKKMIVK